MTYHRFCSSRICREHPGPLIGVFLLPECSCFRSSRERRGDVFRFDSCRIGLEWPVKRPTLTHLFTNPDRSRSLYRADITTDYHCGKAPQRSRSKHMRTQRFATHPQQHRRVPARPFRAPRQPSTLSPHTSAVRLLGIGLSCIALVATGYVRPACAGGLQPGIYLKDSRGDRIHGADSSFERALLTPAGLTVQDLPPYGRYEEKVTRRKISVRRPETSLRPLVVGLLIFVIVELSALWWFRRREPLR